MTFSISGALGGSLRSDEIAFERPDERIIGVLQEESVLKSV